MTKKARETDSLTLYLHPNGCLDDEQTNPTGAEIYEWLENHNTEIDGRTVATDVEAIYNGEPLAETFEKGNGGAWAIFWQDGGDSMYFRVSADGHIECGTEG